MSEWKELPLSKIAKIRRGVSYTGKTISDNSDVGIAYINMKSFLKDGGLNISGIKSYLGGYTERDLITVNDLVIANTDVTLAGDIIGSPAIVPDSMIKQGVVCSHHVSIMRILLNYDSHFLFYLLCLKIHKQQMIRYSRGTTVLMLDTKRIEQINLTIPTSIAEQRKIARILSTVDAVIEKTEAAIAKYKAIKAGMMRDLFTRGIDLATGKLRPSYEESPRLYKHTELGWIPKEWDVVRITDLSKDGLKNGYFKKPEYVGWGYKLINVTDLYQPFGIDINQKDVERVYATLGDYAKYEVQVGDIFFTRSSLVLEGIAHCNIILNLSEKTVWECHVVKLRPDVQKINPEFLGYYCTTYEARLFFMSIAKQVTMTTISQPDIAKLPVPFLKDINEQNEISQRLKAIDTNIKNEGIAHFKYKNLKQALMSDLLTSKVPVKYEEEKKEIA